MSWDIVIFSSKQKINSIEEETEPKQNKSVKSVESVANNKPIDFLKAKELLKRLNELIADSEAERRIKSLNYAPKK